MTPHHLGIIARWNADNHATAVVGTPHYCYASSIHHYLPVGVVSNIGGIFTCSLAGRSAGVVGR